MGLVELIGIAIGLSMDAFAVSICKGLTLKKMDFRKATIVALFFGGFQALMPLLGFFVGSKFADYISEFDHWIAFVLLVVIGAKMLMEAFEHEDKIDSSFEIKTLLVLAIATSIDALMVGLSFAFIEVSSIWVSVSLIGSTTFLLSLVGVKIGNVFGKRYKSKAEIVGGIILILIGLKILLDGLGVL